MRKFKCKRLYHKKTIIIISIILLFSIFIFISLLKINKSYYNFINILLSESFKSDNKSSLIITNNLDNFINSYSFEKK